MDHAAFVCDVERQQQLRDDGDDVRQVETGLAVEVRAEPRPLDIFHRDEGDVFVLAILVDADDVGVVEAARGARLVLEPTYELGGQIGVDEVHADRLDRDGALDVRVERFVDDAHCALAEDTLDFVLAEFFGFAHRSLRCRRRGAGLNFRASSAPARDSSSSVRARASAFRSRRCFASGTRRLRGCRG